MLAWLQGSWLANWIAISPWAYPFLLTAHGLGMAVVVGLTLMVGLRVLGFPAGAPLGAYQATAPLVVVAFLVNAASGVALFVADAQALASNVSFQIKLVSIVAGVAVLWRLYAKVVAPAARAEAQASLAAPVGASAKAMAVAAMLIWCVSVIVSGRLVAYLNPVA